MNATEVAFLSCDLTTGCNSSPDIMRQVVYVSDKYAHPPETESSFARAVRNRVQRRVLTDQREKVLKLIFNGSMLVVLNVTYRVYLQHFLYIFFLMFVRTFISFFLLFSVVVIFMMVFTFSVDIVYEREHVFANGVVFIGLRVVLCCSGECLAGALRNSLPFLLTRV